MVLIHLKTIAKIVARNYQVPSEDTIGFGSEMRMYSHINLRNFQSGIEILFLSRQYAC